MLHGHCEHRMALCQRERGSAELFVSGNTRRVIPFAGVYVFSDHVNYCNFNQLDIHHLELSSGELPQAAIVVSGNPNHRMFTPTSKCNYLKA